MKHYFLILLSFSMNVTVFGQNDTPWVSYYNEDSTLVGFKDKNGVIKNEPVFMPGFSPSKIDHIAAVWQQNEDGISEYHLTSTGKIVGIDSAYMIDLTFDCENEGFLRFRNKETELVGMFDRHGNVVIPAEYSGLTKVHNGMLVGLKGARKEYWDKNDHSGCNHFSLVGGNEVLLDTLNNVIAENFSYDNNLNFYSLLKTKSIIADSIRTTFLARDGSYYSFIDFEKEFEQWIKNDLLKNLTIDRLYEASSDSIRWSSAQGWEKSNRREFIDHNFPVLKKGLSELLDPACDYFISIDYFRSYLCIESEMNTYFDNCGNAKIWLYPVMNVVISHKEPSGFSQNHYDFLRTENGYKLISVTVRNEEIQK